MINHELKDPKAVVSFESTKSIMQAYLSSSNPMLSNVRYVLYLGTKSSRKLLFEAKIRLGITLSFKSNAMMGLPISLD